MCPADYRYAPSALNRTPDLTAEVLYVVGGLYGNLAALGEIERMAARERGRVTIVFNGDYHWFDAEPAWFAEIERGVARHYVMRGNVETEIARGDDIGAGCGCAYPESVDDGIVTRSNEILRNLRAVAPDARGLAALPMHLVAQVGALRVGIVHGDATALAGWRFAHDALDDPANAAWLADVARRIRDRGVRLDAYVPCGPARFCISGAPPDCREQRCSRHGEFRRLDPWADHAYRATPIPAPAALRHCA